MVSFTRRYNIFAPKLLDTVYIIVLLLTSSLCPLAERKLHIPNYILVTD